MNQERNLAAFFSSLCSEAFNGFFGALLILLISSGLPVWAATEQTELTLNLVAIERETGGWRYDAQATGPSAYLVRRALHSPLIRSSEKGIGLALADSVNVSADYRKWSFRLASGAAHSDGRRLTATDAVASLNSCSELIAAEGSVDGSGAPARVQFSARQGPGGEEWVDASLGVEIEGSATGARDFAARLARCPIYQRYAEAIFGEAFATESNYIGAGAFEIGPRRSKNEMVLVQAHSILGSSAKAINIVRRTDEELALSQLREGKVDILFGVSSILTERVRTDETMAVLHCDGFSGIYRRTLHIDCQNGLDVPNIFYN